MLNDGKKFWSIAAVRLVLEGRGKKFKNQYRNLNRESKKNFKKMSREPKTAEKNGFSGFEKAPLSFGDRQ
jgi:hypothetical protein